MKDSTMPSALSQSVTVSIVSHGQGDLIYPLLRQLNAFSQDCIALVVVTLNLPETFSAEGLGLRFPVKLMTNTEPKGFGANHNQAFGQCQTAWFLVLNPDVEMRVPTLQAMLSSAQALVPSTGLMAPAVREPGCPQVTPERDVITPWEVLAGRLNARHPPSQPVWFPGMFMLFRAVAFDAVKGFDERFHMYCEDFDVCARLRLAGWTLARNTETEVVHLAQRHSHERMRYLVWHLQSLWRVWTSGVLWRYRRELRREQAIS